MSTISTTLLAACRTLPRRKPGYRCGVSALLNPSGPEARSTYWKRRALVLVVLVLIVVLLILGLRALLGGGGNPPTASSNDSASASVSPTESATPTESTVSASTPASAAVSACDPGDIMLTATTDKASYPRTTSAQMGMTIQSKATADCTFDVGSKALELTVMSGNDRIWSSDDCQKAGESRIVTVKPADAGKLNSRVEWDLTRSRAGCSTATKSAKVSPGTYTLVARAGDLRSPAKSFRVTAK